LMREMVYRILH